MLDKVYAQRFRHLLYDCTLFRCRDSRGCYPGKIFSRTIHMPRGSLYPKHVISPHALRYAGKAIAIRRQSFHSRVKITVVEVGRQLCIPVGVQSQRDATQKLRNHNVHVLHLPPDSSLFLGLNGRETQQTAISVQTHALRRSNGNAHQRKPCRWSGTIAHCELVRISISISM